MIALLAPLFALAGAVLYRHRGGFLPTYHTQLARLDFSIGMALLLYLATGDWALALISVPAWFLGCFAPNGDWMGIANTEQLVWGCYSGLLNVGAVVPVAAVFGHWQLALLLMVAGALKGPLYLAAKYLPDWNVPQFHRGPECGEALFGAALGLALAL